MSHFCAHGHLYNLDGDPTGPQRNSAADGCQAPAVLLEARDLEARIRLLREASRPSEPFEVPALYEDGVRGRTLVAVAHPSAQGHITSAITQLERRRAELLGKKG
jgi:hypothetical protein